MTEQEIIDFLKKNKKTGIAFAFMPKEVQDWINDASSKIVYLIFKSGSWEDLPIEATANEEDVFALPDSFQMLKEQKNGWVEFNVNSKGEIAVDIDDDNEPTVFYWNEWGVVITYSRSSRNKAKYVAFGGWQYKEHSEFWYTSPQMLTDVQKGCISSICDGRFNDCKPLVPIKIRFWRESQ